MLACAIAIAYIYLWYVPIPRSVLVCLEQNRPRYVHVPIAIAKEACAHTYFCLEVCFSIINFTHLHITNFIQITNDLCGQLSCTASTLVLLHMGTPQAVLIFPDIDAFILVPHCNMH